MLEESGVVALEDEDYGDDSERLRSYAEKKYDPKTGSQTLKMDPEWNGDGN